ncbi:hypothetical protein PR048_018330 [Dryococelus australis]|uniref:Uncharacterized protein n=1 Tax=Dryococelus australis TaxID=614101 RepID=A0ABQ9HC69_9NEOP|nr:hypothetical protein PR048_018330 [Dryococelus australis]
MFLYHQTVTQILVRDMVRYDHRTDPYENNEAGVTCHEGGVLVMELWQDGSQQCQLLNSVVCFFTSIDQHIDSTKYRRMRDNIDVQKCCDWFDSQDLFPLIGTILDCWGMKTSTTMKLTKLGNQELKFQRKNRVMPLRGVNCAVKIKDEQDPVNHDTVFRRVPFHMKSHEKLRSYFAFELAPYK